jgi:ADP-L-glycero-D-manno-heptose 6-epimerase
MIIVTGALGFIGSYLISELNQKGFYNIIAVDDFSPVSLNKKRNLNQKKISEYVNRNDLFSWLDKNSIDIDFIFHIGARTDTMEKSEELFNELNLDYSKKLFLFCTKKQIPIIYASSAATYGLGERGYNDSDESTPNLKPLNPYGWSKHNFDLWVLNQNDKPPFWVGLKFFNVYGPNEYHKDRMASVIYHSYNQINETSQINLFESHKDGLENGHQKRDFIYVKDVVDVIIWFYNLRDKSGIYNLGTGKARTFLDLAKSVFKSMNIKEKINFIPTPESIRDSYQYFTEANMNKLRNAGYSKPFTSLEDGIEDYIKNYLEQ